MAEGVLQAFVSRVLVVHLLEFALFRPNLYTTPARAIHSPIHPPIPSTPKRIPWRNHVCLTSFSTPFRVGPCDGRARRSPASCAVFARAPATVVCTSDALSRRISVSGSCTQPQAARSTWETMLDSSGSMWSGNSMASCICGSSGSNDCPRVACPVLRQPACGQYVGEAAL